MLYRLQPLTRRCWQSSNWPWIAIGLMSVLCCSCRSLDPLTLWPNTNTNTVKNAPQQPSAKAPELAAAAYQEPADPPPQATFPQPDKQLPPATVTRGLPQSAWSGHPSNPIAPPMLSPGNPAYPWAPPGLPRPWPADEWVLDGGDRARQVNVAQDWSVHGLDEEDTVVHFDTLDGDLVIQPSNRVAVYAPRFAAVRRIDGIVQNEYTFGTLSNHQVQELERQRSANMDLGLTQQLQPQRHLAMSTPNGFRERLPERTVDNVQNAAGADYIFESYEDFFIIRRGVFDNNEKPRLNQRILAAESWASPQGVQVVLDGKLPTEFANERTTGEQFIYQMPTGKKRLRVVKVASQQQAESGDILEFTIRFDNTGDQTIGNVTVLDNLTPRLEYIPESQSCSVNGNFMTQKNDGQSLLLRWEITDPLKVGEGGIIRFKCRVR
jgi:uncharacterized repeat protein (TIGR01451 family)